MKNQEVLPKRKHFSHITAKDINKQEFEDQRSLTKKRHCHFLGFTILWRQKLKFSIKPPLDVDEENIQTSSQTKTVTDENIFEINSPLYTKKRLK